MILSSFQTIASGLVINPNNIGKRTRLINVTGSLAYGAGYQFSFGVGTPPTFFPPGSYIDWAMSFSLQDGAHNTLYRFDCSVHSVPPPAADAVSASITGTYTILPIDQARRIGSFSVTPPTNYPGIPNQPNVANNFLIVTPILVIQPSEYTRTGDDVTMYVVLHSYSASSNHVDTEDIGYRLEASQASPPTAVFSYTADGTDVTFDASASAASGGVPNPGNQELQYEWDFGDSASDTGRVVEHEYDTDGSHLVELRTTDVHGSFKRSRSTISILEIPHAAALSDESGVLTVTRRNGNNIEVRRHAAGSTSGQTIGSIPNARVPTLFQNGARNEFAAFYAMVQDRTTKEWGLLVSEDKGVSWEEVMGVPAFDDTYKSASACGTIEGAVVAVGVKKTTGAVNVRRTFDGGETWSDPVQIASGGRSFVQIVQESSVGATRLIAVDHGGPFSYSRDLGATWGSS